MKWTQRKLAMETTNDRSFLLRSDQLVTRKGVKYRQMCCDKCDEMCTIQLSKDQYSPVQPSTAQYSPPQPSTAQYSPLQSRQSFAQKHPGLVHYVFHIYCLGLLWVAPSIFTGEVVDINTKIVITYHHYHCQQRHSSVSSLSICFPSHFLDFLERLLITVHSPYVPFGFTEGLVPSIKKNAFCRNVSQDSVFSV